MVANNYRQSITAFVPSSLKKEVKKLAVEKETSVSSILEQALLRYITDLNSPASSPIILREQVGEYKVVGETESRKSESLNSDCGTKSHNILGK